MNQSKCGACGLVSHDTDLIRVVEGKDKIVMCPGCRNEGTLSPVSDETETESV